MKINITFISAVLAILVLPALAQTESTGTVSLSRSGQAVVGEAAPFLSGWTLDEKVFNTTKVFKDPDVARLALVFWASWCKPCIVGLKALAAADSLFSEKGVKVVLVNYVEEKQKIRDFLAGRSAPFPVVLDRWGKSGQKYLADADGRVSLPRTVLIDHNGVVEAIFSSEGTDYVQRILAGR